MVRQGCKREGTATLGKAQNFTILPGAFFCTESDKIISGGWAGNSVTLMIQ